MAGGNWGIFGEMNCIAGDCGMVANCFVQWFLLMEKTDPCEIIEICFSEYACAIGARAFGSCTAGADALRGDIQAT